MLTSFGCGYIFGTKYSSLTEVLKLCGDFYMDIEFWNGFWSARNDLFFV